MHSQTGDAARAAVGHELLEPAESLAGVGGGGHGGGNQLGGAGVRGDVLLVVAGSLGGRHVSLGGHVGLVEAHDVVAARGQQGLDAGQPAAEELGTPEHGDVVDAGGEIAIQGESPVVGPADGAGGGKRRDGGNVVVCSAALGGSTLLHSVQAAVHVVGRGQGRGGHQAGREQVGERDHFCRFCVGFFFCCGLVTEGVD